MQVRECGREMVLRATPGTQSSVASAGNEVRMTARLAFGLPDTRTSTSLAPTGMQIPNA